ncbi:WD40-repeat-containing domain protein [Mycena vitilis]|nr:WD40-repeat-containing domain protein [Mycena vitilis]
MSFFSAKSYDEALGQNGTGAYALHGVLSGHKGSVNCMKVTEDGILLASGGTFGTDGVMLWDLGRMQKLERPSGAGSRGATSSLIWLRREDKPGEILVFGTQTGLVVCWRQAASSKQTFEETSVFKMAEPAEITGLAFDSSSNRLAVCHRMSVVQVHDMDDKLNPSPVFSVCVNNLLPRALAFAGERQKELIVFNFHDGTMMTLSADTGAVVRSRQIGCMIGSVDYNSRRGVFCLDDPFQGTVLYRINDEARVRVFENKLTKPSARPRQVCFGDNCSSVVSGSDHGVVYVHDRRSGEVTDALRVHPNDWVQTVTATQVDGISTIIAARSRDWGGANGITVWRKKKTTQSGRRLWIGSIVVVNLMLVVAGAVHELAFFPSPSTTVLPAAMAFKPPPASGRMRPADPVFHHGLRPCDAYVVQSHKPPPMRTPQRCAPLTPIKIEDYTDDEDDLMYYCENCDPCPVCGSPPIVETQEAQPPPVAAPTTAQAAPHPARPLAFQTVSLALPVTIFIVEAWIAGDWRHLVVPYLIGIALCYI